VPGPSDSSRRAPSIDPLGPGIGEELTEVSLTWHLGEALGTGWYSIGAGAGVAWGRTWTRQGFTTSERKIGLSPGLAIEGKVNWRPTGSLGREKRPHKACMLLYARAGQSAECHPREDVASVQKRVIALLTLMAEECGHLSLEDLIGVYLGPKLVSAPAGAGI